MSRILVGSYLLNFCDHSLISLIVGLTMKGIVSTVSEPLQLSAAMASREVFENVEVCWLSAILFFFVLNNFDAFRNNICKMWWDNGRDKIAYLEVVVSC